MTIGPVPSDAPPPRPGIGRGTDSASVSTAAPQSHPDADDSQGKPPVRPYAIEGLLILSICVLAFLLASTPARNSDLWLHLASGRWLSAAWLPDGTEPFSSTTQGLFWVNHSWLSDFLFYETYRLGDGTALVVAKAVLTALLAALLCCFRRRGEGMGILAISAFVALLALGPWLALQPALLSLLGVVLTLYLLERPHLVESVSAGRARSWRWLLIPLFALWANLDGWFILGPILVGIYAIGGLLHHPSSKSGGAPHASRLFLLFCAGLVACLATPYHYRIFEWPISLGLTHAEQALRHDSISQAWGLSPFAARFADSSLFRSPAAWAYYFLLGVSAVSFLLPLRTLHSGRLLVWLVLAALSIYQARTIPFFVVAAAPYLSLNIQEWLRSRTTAVPPAGSRSAQPILQLMGLIFGIVLLVLAWPGWLQPAPYQPRGWTLEPDGALVRLTDQLKRWHAEGRLPSDHFALNFSPEVAHYLAWYCPEEKGFVDSRWPLFDRVADDYAGIRRCLLQGASRDSGHELAALLDAHRIDRILLYDSDWSRMTQVYLHLFSAPEWELLAVQGGATVFRRRGAAPSLEAFNYRRAVYRPAVDQRSPSSLNPPQPPTWYDAFRRRPDRGSADREEAALHLLSFDVQTQQIAIQGLLTQATNLIGCGPGLRSAALLYCTQPFPPSPLEPLLLAVHAARRGLAANPDDARAFLLLGEANYKLDQQAMEPYWQALRPELPALRQAQTLTALEQAVRLRPDLDRALALLTQLYYEAGQMDRCLDYLRARLRIAEKVDKQADSTAALKSEVEKMEKFVNQLEKTYQANVADKTEPSKVLMRAETAARNGLSRKALEMLQESSPAIYGRSGLDYELDLMMKAGQSYEVREVLKPVPELKTDLNTYQAYHWLKARAAASCGEYAEADAELDKGSEPYRRIGLTPKLFVPARSAVALHLTRAVLGRPPWMEGVAGRVNSLYFQFQTLQILGSAAEPLRKEADRQVLRGLIALEGGAIEEAKRLFQSALDVWGSDTVAEAGAGLDFPARPIAQEILRRMQE